MRYGTGVVLVIAAATLWSLMGLTIRQIEVAGTWSILFWRSLGVLPVLLALVWWRAQGEGGPSFGARLTAIGWPGIIGAAGLVLAFAGAIFAIQATTVANAVFLFSASPFLAAVLGWLLLKEPVRPATWAAIVLAGIGMFIMVR